MLRDSLRVSLGYSNGDFRAPPIAMPLWPYLGPGSEGWYLLTITEGQPIWTDFRAHSSRNLDKSGGKSTL